MRYKSYPVMSDVDCTDVRTTSSLSGTDCMIVDNGIEVFVAPKFNTMKKISADASLASCLLYNKTFGPKMFFMLKTFHKVMISILIN